MKKQEFYNPQFERENWVSLNGEWSFQILSPLMNKKKKINVPYCPESKASGIEYKDFIKECEYSLDFNVNSFKDKSVILHFGAVYYEAIVFVNGKKVGRHFGGYTPFSFDITSFVNEGKNNLSVKVFSDLTANQPSGKQSRKPMSYGCFYTRTTGIWQSVWLEYVPKRHLEYLKYFPNINDCSVNVEVGVKDEGKINIEVFYNGKQVGKHEDYVKIKGVYTIKLLEKHLWEVGNGRLYDVKISYEEDNVSSYFGLREVKFDGMDFLLNGKKVFQSFVLDQGYYKKGVYTPSDDNERLNDINSAISLGFNGSRLHQKVFEPRYLYLCDKLGHMVWGEFASWGIKYDNLDALGTFISEWTAVIERDFNHPSIILWCPLNETWRDLDDNRKTRDVRFIDSVYQVTKALDGTRPCVDVSGGYHGHNTDLYDFHCYESYENLQKYLNELTEEGKLEVPLLYDDDEKQLFYVKGLPVNVSEFGGIQFAKDKALSQVSSVNEGAVQSTESWGYGEGTTDENAFVERYKKLVELIKSYSEISGFCYTQLYDVEQEENGFFTYDRKPKLSQSAIEQICECNKK
ncbi:MAG: beta-galactosidase [Clostridia bacterium]|nr:beta-galactosidase [Clostridia bacterium]